MYGDSAPITFCTGTLLRTRDSEPQYGFQFKIFHGLHVGLTWLTDLEMRNGVFLWTLHGQRIAPHYCVTSGVHGTKRHGVTLSKSVRHEHGSLDIRMVKTNRGVQVISTQEEIRYALKMAAVRVSIAQNPGPTWKRNSCHLDTFLLSELAFYTSFDCINVQVPSDITAIPPGIRRLWKVLVTLGAFTDRHPLHQDTHRDAYRIYEMSHLSSDEMKNAVQQRGMCDYRWHADFLQATIDPAYLRGERLLGCGVRTSCTGHDADGEAEMRFRSMVPCPTAWWPMSDGTASRELTPEELYSGFSGVQHGGIKDVLLSHIGRPSGDHVNCFSTPTCTDNPAAYQTYEKLPRLTQFPRSLEFDANSITNAVPWEHQLNLQIGRLLYELVSITFQNENHYVILVRLREKWWFYNDLYKQTYVDKTKGKPTLREVSSDKVHDFAPGTFDPILRNHGFYPRTWRYSLNPESAGVHSDNTGSVTDDSIDYTNYTAVGYNDPALLGSTHDTILQGV
jgi:hypothetical protein